MRSVAAMQPCIRTALECCTVSHDTPPLPQFTPPAEAKLTSSDGIRNASALLRNALPIENKAIREVQVSRKHAGHA